VVIVEGELVEVKRNAGSKSEHRGFAVRTADGNDVVIDKRGDNPFEHESLRPLKGRRIRAEGAFYRGRLVADSVDPL
jgi:hypothetical protein